MLSDNPEAIIRRPPTFAVLSITITMSLRIPRNTASIARRSYASSSSASLDAYAKLNTRAWKGTSVDGTAVKNFIGGKFVASKATTHYDVYNPVGRRIAARDLADSQATQELVTRTPQTTPAELREAFEVAQDAWKTWKQTSLFSRQNILFK